MTKKQWILKNGINNKTKIYDIRIMEEIQKMDEDLFEVLKDKRIWSDALQFLNEVEAVNSFLAIEIAKVTGNIQLMKQALKLRDIINWSEEDVIIAFFEAETELSTKVKNLDEVLLDLEAKIRFNASF